MNHKEKITIKNLLKTTALTVAFVGLLGAAIPSVAVTGGRQSTNSTRTTGNIIIDGEDLGSVSELYGDDSLYYASFGETTEETKNMVDAAKQYWNAIKQATNDRDNRAALERTQYWNDVKKAISERDASNAQERENYQNDVNNAIATRDAAIEEIKAAYANEPAEYMAARNAATSQYASDMDAANAAYDAAVEQINAAYAADSDAVNTQLALEWGAIDIMMATGVLNPENAEMMRAAAAGIAQTQINASYANYANALAEAQATCAASKAAAEGRYANDMAAIEAKHAAAEDQYHADIRAAQDKAVNAIQEANDTYASEVERNNRVSDLEMDVAQIRYERQVDSAVKKADEAIVTAQEQYESRMVEIQNAANATSGSVTQQ